MIVHAWAWAIDMGPAGRGSGSDYTSRYNISDLSTLNWKGGMERAEEGHPDLLPPAKRPRVEPDLIQGTENARKPPASKQPLQTVEFPLFNLEDFYKPCPSYRLPVEIGAFSINGTGELRLDRSQLKYYAPPGRLNQI